MELPLQMNGAEWGAMTRLSLPECEMVRASVAPIVALERPDWRGLLQVLDEGISLLEEPALLHHLLEDVDVLLGLVPQLHDLRALTGRVELLPELLQTGHRLRQPVVVLDGPHGETALPVGLELDARNLSGHVGPPPRRVDGDRLPFVPLLVALNRGEHRVVELPDKEAGVHGVRNGVELILEGDVVQGLLGLQAKQAVLDGVHVPLCADSDVGREVVTAKGARVSGHKGPEERLESLEDRFPLFGIAAVCYLWNGMEEPPDGVAEVVGKAHAHLGTLDEGGAQVDVHERDVARQASGPPVVRLYLPLPLLLNAVQVAPGETPGLHDDHLDVPVALREPQADIMSIRRKLIPVESRLKPCVDLLFCQVCPALECPGISCHAASCAEPRHELLVPPTHLNHAPFELLVSMRQQNLEKASRWRIRQQSRVPAIREMQIDR